jgi:hypothetical protein
MFNLVFFPFFKFGEPPIVIADHLERHAAVKHQGSGLQENQDSLRRQEKLLYLPV